MAPAPVHNWTGLYVGGHVGWAWANETATILTPFVFLPAGATFGLDSDGFIGGGQIGFNYQFHPNWVIGIEGDVSWTDHGASATQAAGTINFGAVTVPFSAAFATDHNWYATLTGRLGYTWGPGLLYVKGGFAWMNADYTSTAVGLGTVSQTIGDTRTGWTIGVGLEYAFAPNWSVKIEYDYLDFGTDRYTFATTGLSFDVDTDVHQVKLGVNYRFNLGGPVVARY